MSDRRVLRLATTGARLLAGTLVAAAFATAVVTAVAAPWPTLRREPLTVAANPAPADAVTVCAGPLLALGRDPDRADALTVATIQDVVIGAPIDGAAPVSSVLSSPSVPDSAGPTVLTAEPQDRVRSEVAASGSATVAADDLAGFAASACLMPLLDSWIVGGATTTGSNDLLLLGNPGEVAATVQLTVYSATGAQIPPGGAGLVVAPGEQRIVPLAGLVLGEEAPVVRVTAAGAPVQAALQSSITRTLVPGGVDQESVTAGASTTQVIPGIVVGAVDDATSDPATVLRLLSPDADTTATVSMLGRNGTPSAQEIPLTAGLPAQVDLDGAAAGTYTVIVDAGSPIVSAVWQATGFASGSDFAWYTAAPPVTAEALVAVPDGPSPVLWMVNSGDDVATVTVESLFDGTSVPVSIPAGEAVSQPVTAGDVYRITTSDAPVHASVTFSGDGALAAVPVWPEDAVAQTVVVHP